MRSCTFLHVPVYTWYWLFLPIHCAALPGTLGFEQQVLLNPVIAISDEEIKAMQQFWSQNICFPTHRSLSDFSSGPHNLIYIDVPI